MSDTTVPDVLNAKFCECRTENCEITEGNDINWCTGFWNELARENPPRYTVLSFVIRVKVLLN